METSQKRSESEKVRQQLTKLLTPFGFQRTKPTFWTRRNDYTVDFVHLHLYTFAPAFRTHCGIRVLNDSFSALGLNGPDANGIAGNRFEFSDTTESLMSCATHIADFVQDLGEPWFARWRQPNTLMTSAESPLTSDAMAALKTALQGDSSVEFVVQSERLLGLNR